MPTLTAPAAAAPKPQRIWDDDEALSYEPFAGDETDVSVLADKIVKAAKDHPSCQICEAPIPKGERHRARSERNNEEKKIMTFRFCGKCCYAMAHPDTQFGEGRLMDSRERVGDQRRAVKALGA